jgi:hypothetical protein
MDSASFGVQYIMSKVFDPKKMPAKEPLNFMFWDKLRVDHSSSSAAGDDGE